MNKLTDLLFFSTTVLAAAITLGLLIVVAGYVLLEVKSVWMLLF